ncbi:MBL fold metallo-hydrolase [Bacillus sp. 1P02SD]|uniref:MBL fold metallo-hydrolase n=1 Tax=Bacillus sp. 1P02SD TaxID=3132264 RepID=UPI0039A3A079
MKINDQIYLVGSGLLGMNQTDKYDCNVYLVDGGDSLILIDSGAGINPSKIVEEIVRNGYRPEMIDYILLTHAHADHSGGAHSLQQISGAKIVCSKDTANMIKEADEEKMSLVSSKKTGVYPRDYTFHRVTDCIEVCDQDTLQIGGLTIQVIETPGHSHDSISFYMEEIHTLLSGDLVFDRGKIAKLSTWDFSLQDLKKSINRVADLSIDVLLPGHMSPVVRNGHDAIRKAKGIFDQHKIPESIV